MKNKNFWILFAVFTVGIVFRLLFLDKPSGLSYDELVSFKQAVQPNAISTIFYTLQTDVHLPFYQVLLHWWCKIFSFSDIALRAFSAFCGILSVFVAFFIGKELKNQTAKILCPTLFAINSFFIYYSQEVRMYSLLILLTTLSVLLLLKIKNNNSNKWNYIMLVAVSFSIIHTYTIAFIYVIALFATLVFYLYLKKSTLKPLGISAISLGILCLPTFLFLSANSSKYTTLINGFYCDWSSLFVGLQDLFTPVLEGLSNNPEHYMLSFFSTFALSKLFFIVIPIFIAIAGMCFAIKRKKENLLIIAPATIFILAEIFAFKFTNFKILPRYMSVAMPAFLTLVAYGFSFIPKKKSLNIILPTLFIVLNLTYLLFNPNSAYKYPRSGYKPIALAINSANTHNGDFVVIWNRKEILDKYLDKNFVILSTLQDFAYKSETMLAHEQEFSGMLIPERKEILKPYFLENKLPNNTLLLISFVLNRMPKGQKFIIVASPKFVSYDNQKFKELVENSQNYNSTSLNDLLTIKSLVDIIRICDYNLKLVDKKEVDPFVMFVYEK